ncbi:MAG: DUF6249 domain-containing protein [Steroidobacteraceae bacterium]|jgi:hypothetical protein|nr:DUF6249 domain-containing protein [Steroidobacteraceae bacterium]
MGPEIVAVLIPLAAIVLGISVAIVGIVSRHRQLLQRTDLRHKERMAAIEKGLELPPDPPEMDIRRPRYLLKGLVWSFTGAAVYVMLDSLAGAEEAKIGLIPVAVGLAYLVYYAVQGRKEDRPAGAGENPAGR